MFDVLHSPVTIRLAAVASRRDGWHPRPLSTLSQLAAVDAAALSADEALSVLHTLQRERASLDALEARLLVRAAGARQVVRDVLVDEESAEGRTRVRTIHFTDEVVDEIAATLRRPVATVHAEVSTARLLNGPLRRTRDALAEGRITAHHARAIADQAARMMQAPLGENPLADAVFEQSCAALEARVLHRAESETPGETRQRARRAVVAIDAAAARSRRQRARCSRDVQAWGEDDGLGVVMARLAASDAAWVMGAVDSHARAHANDGRLTLDPDASWGEVRAAAFLDLLRGGGEETAKPRVSVELQVLIDLATLTGVTPDLPATVTVGSSRDTEVARDDVLSLLSDPSTPVTLRRLICDPVTGALVDRGAHRYTASAELTQWLVARDQTCRHPGCRRRAISCDVDHADDFADGGSTTLANTGMLCRRHHNRKTHSGWRIEDSRSDGSCTFVSPTGRRFPHLPTDLLPERPPTDPDPPPF